MKLKQIAVITEYIDNQYNIDVFRGIDGYFAGKDCQVIYIETRNPISERTDFEYQYWPALSLAASKSIDALIFIAGTYSSSYPIEKLSALIKPYCKVPVVSVALDLGFENSYFSKSDCTSGIKEVVNHLIDKHGCKKIGFYTAAKTSSTESVERFEAYKNALSERGVPFDPSIVLDGDFQQRHVASDMAEMYPTRESVNFDAMVCVNDQTAFGVIQHLSELGLKVPDDVKVVGYDDSPRASASMLTLSSINQQIEQQGYAAAKLAHSILNGENPKREASVEVKPVYRQSCGCDDGAHFESIGNNYFNEKIKDIIQYQEVSSSYLHIYSLVDKLQVTHTLTEVFNLVMRILPDVSINCAAIVLYDELALSERGKSFVLPEKARLAMYFDHASSSKNLDCNIPFNPHETLFPECEISSSNNSFYLAPIFYGDLQYGYIIYRPLKRNNSLYNVYIKILNYAIVKAYDYTKALINNSNLEKTNLELVANNTQLDIASRTDDMTKVLNRRGFLHMGQQSINLALQLNSGGLVIYGDMDGLKKINDTYGHDAGDAAILAEAKILSKVFRSSDVIGRLGGDEFAIVAQGMDREMLSTIEKEIRSACKHWKAETKSAFDLSISLGAIEFGKEHFILQDLLSEADSRMYKAKRAEKKARGQ